MCKKNIVIGSDHAGFDMKEKLKKFLQEEGLDVIDTGVYTAEPADYPSAAKKAAQEALSKNCCAVLICGTGIGMSIAANKIKGIRAAVCSDVSSARLSKLHNNSNVLCLGARIIGEITAKDILKVWLETDFEGGRHQKRLDMIE